MIFSMAFGLYPSRVFVRGSRIYVRRVMIICGILLVKTSDWFDREIISRLSIDPT